MQSDFRLQICTLHLALCILHLAMPPVVTAQRLEADAAANLTTDLDPSWLESTKHPQTGLLSRSIRPEEAADYFAILNHARQVPLAELKSAASRFQSERFAAIRHDRDFQFYFRKANVEFPTYADLHRNPESSHGRLVTFRGHLRRLISSPAGENAHGLQQLHEAWLYAEGAQQNPIVVVCTELPPKLPAGSDILVDFVTATGYFFKRYGYEDRSGKLRFAPLILAQRLEWHPRPARLELTPPRLLFGLTLGLAAVVFVGIWLASRTRCRTRQVEPVYDPQSREPT